MSTKLNILDWVTRRWRHDDLTTAVMDLRRAEYAIEEAHTRASRIEGESFGKPAAEKRRLLEQLDQARERIPVAEAEYVQAFQRAVKAVIR